jgi:hypothetical protein
VAEGFMEARGHVAVARSKSSDENGLLSSKIRNIAPGADSAKKDRQVKTVAFKGENRLKLANMMTSQRTSDGEKRSWNHVFRLRKYQEPGLHQVGANPRRTGLK